MVTGIIGAGPAGIACASILARYHHEVYLFEEKEIGGLLNNARWIENFPGLQPMTGKELVEQLKRSLNSNYIQFIQERVVLIKEQMIQTFSGKIFNVDQLVMAIGTKPEIIEDWVKIPRIVYEWRDLPKNIQTLGILGAGDSAFDSGLSGLDNHYKVFLWNRSERIKALPSLYQSYIQAGGAYFTKEPILDIKPTPSGLQIQTGKRTLTVEALLVSIGRKKNTLSGTELIDSSIKEIGDYAHPQFRQASIAIGDGIRIGMEIVRG